MRVAEGCQWWLRDNARKIGRSGEYWCIGTAVASYAEVTGSISGRGCIDLFMQVALKGYCPVEGGR